MSDVQPSNTFPISNAEAKAYAIYIDVRAATKNPVRAAILSGTTENEVMPVKANDTIFLMLYLVVPEKRLFGRYCTLVVLNPNQPNIPLKKSSLSPRFLILSIIIVSVWGISVIPDVIIAWLANYFCTLLMFYTQKPEFPFTQSKATNLGGVYMI